MHEVKCLLWLAKVYQSHRREDVLETLNKVTEKQTHALYWPFSQGG